MQKKYLIIGLFLFLLAPFAYGTYYTAIKVTAENVIDHFNNFELEYDRDHYIIHHKTGCGDINEGTELTAVISGDLDANQDELRRGTSYICQIDQAEPFHEKYTVDDITSSDSHTEILNKTGHPYRIFYSTACGAVRNMAGQDIYVYHYGYGLNAGDEIILPGNQGKCTINYVQDVALEGVSSAETNPYAGLDTKRPTTPGNFRAIPSTNAVYLYWEPATDDVGISHYIISASLYHVEDARARDPEDGPQYMPNQIPTKGNVTSMRLDNLESDELYFFRVIAMDTSGNTSNYWSEEATAMTRSSILNTAVNPELLTLNLIQETSDYFLYEWNTPSGGQRATLTLDVDGERVYANSDWPYDRVRILKKPDRKGKTLRLTIRTYDFRGLMQEKKATMSF